MNPRLAALATDPAFRAARYALALLLGATCGAVLAIHRAVNPNKEWVKLSLDKVSIFLYPGRNDLAVVTFDQVYTSSNLDSQMRKRLYWLREADAWHIIHEGAA